MHRKKPNLGLAFWSFRSIFTNIFCLLEYLFIFRDFLPNCYSQKHSCQRFVTSKNALVHLIRFSAHSAFAAFLVVVYRTLSDFICTSGGHQPTQWRNAWQVSTSQFEEGFSNGFLFGELFKKFKQVRRRCLYSDSFVAAHPVVIAFPSGISSRIYGHDLLIMFV